MTPGGTEAGALGRVPVFTPWLPDIGPSLAMGRLTSMARAAHGGTLAEAYEIHRPLLGQEVLHRLADATGPVVVLLSNYIWSVEGNLALAREMLTVRDDVVFVHGGPSTPARHVDALEFLTSNSDVAHVLAVGEGEATLTDLLTTLTDSLVVQRDPTAWRNGVLDDVRGLLYLTPTGELHDGGTRPRMDDLTSLPSPKEFDDIDAAAWKYGAFVETNRGCPTAVRSATGDRPRCRE